MVLTDEDIQELKQIHKEEFGEELTDGEAREMGMRLMRLWEMVDDPPPRKVATEENCQITRRTFCSLRRTDQLASSAITEA